MKKVITLWNGRQLVGNVVVDDPAFVDLAWTEEVQDGDRNARSVNMQAHVPREAIRLELTA